jgi:hypothetical protein
MKIFTRPELGAFALIAISLAPLSALADDSGDPSGSIGVVTTGTAHGKTKTPEIMLGVDVHFAGGVKAPSNGVGAEKPVKDKSLPIAMDTLLQLSAGRTSEPKSKVVLDGDYQVRVNGSFIDQNQVGNSVRGVFGVTATVMGRGHDELGHGRPHDKDTSFVEALIMGSAGVQLATNNCRILLTAQAGGGAGTVGDAGGQSAMGSSMYLNCRKLIDASLHHERITARRSQDGGPYITDVLTADVRTNFATNRTIKENSAPWSVGLRAQAFVPHEQGGNSFDAGPVNRDGVDTRVQVVAGKAF